MSHMTEEINKVTGTVISVAGRLVICAVILMLLIEGMVRGYAFGYEVFNPTPVDAAPGRDQDITLREGDSDWENLRMLADAGLIRSDLIAYIQMKFYEYELHPGDYTLNTSLTSKEILQILNEKTEEDAGAGTDAPGLPKVEIQINGLWPGDGFRLLMAGAAL